MLSTQQIERIANAVLSEHLGSVGFQRSEVKDDLDQDGERALMVTALFEAGALPTDGELMVNALTALRNELLARGDERFPYLRYTVQGDEAVVDVNDFA